MKAWVGRLASAGRHHRHDHVASRIRFTASGNIRSFRVWSCDDFSRLRHVIVGSASGGCIPPGDIRGDAGNVGPRDAADVEEGNRLLDNYAAILRSHGVEVDRPEDGDWSRRVGTPNWTVENEFGCMAPRDTLLTVGNEILEAPLPSRARWFETRVFRPLLEQYFRNDPHFRWESAPKPRLRAESFNEDFKFDKDYLDYGKPLPLAEQEPLFDAADVMRIGKDLFVKRGLTTNRAGVEWLRRHFPQQRVHVLEFEGAPLPIHMDATFVALRPGLILNGPTQRLASRHRLFFEKNGWDIIEAAQPAHDGPPPRCSVSKWCSMNVMNIDEKTVCVEASEVNTQAQLKDLGFDVVPVPLRNAYMFGGGLHCATADVCRDGEMKDYFPWQEDDGSPY